MKITCPCKRIKKEVSCETVRKGTVPVECDDVCTQKKLEEKKQKELENEQKKKEEELRNQRELEKYEKKFHGKKKNREKKTFDQVEENSMLQKYWFVPIAVVIFAFGLYYIMKSS